MTGETRTTARIVGGHVAELELRETRLAEAHSKIEKELVATRKALKHARRSAGEVGAVVEAQEPPPRPLPAAPAPDRGRLEPPEPVPDKADRVAEVLVAAGEPLTRAEIGERIGGAQGLHFLLASMVRKGLLVLVDTSDDPTYAVPAPEVLA